MRHVTALSCIACRIPFPCRVFSGAFSAAADTAPTPVPADRKARIVLYPTDSLYKLTEMGLNLP
jgi:hypothetical protein